MSQQKDKRQHPTSFAASDTHLNALKNMAALNPLYPPTRSQLIGDCILYVSHRIQTGKATLKDISDAARSEE